MVYSKIERSSYNQSWYSRNREYHREYMKLYYRQRFIKDLLVPSPYMKQRNNNDNDNINNQKKNEFVFYFN